MPKTADINHVPGVYRSECCGVEKTMPDNFKYPPCLGSGKSGESRCAGQNANWIMVRPTQMITAESHLRSSGKGFVGGGK